MPYLNDWKPPAVAFMIEGYPVYYCYRNDECSVEEATTMSEWYQVEPSPGDVYDPEAMRDFDIRELPEHKESEERRQNELGEGHNMLFDCEQDHRKYHYQILFDALRSGSLAKHLGIEIDFPPKVDTYDVDITRVTSRTMKAKVKARSEQEAMDMALEKAGDLDFTQCTDSEPEYTAEAYLVKRKTD